MKEKATLFLELTYGGKDYGFFLEHSGSHSPIPGERSKEG